MAAGLDEIVTPALLARGIAITNASGVHGPNIAEHVLAMMLMFTRGLPKLFRAQLARRWERNMNSRTDAFGELTGKTLVIVGLGRIGEAIAARARPFGIRVVALKRDRRPGTTPASRSTSCWAWTRSTRRWASPTTPA